MNSIRPRPIEKQTMKERLQRWMGKTALVTGATSGIGYATAEALAGIGMKVAITGRRAERLAELKERLESGGAEILTIPVDQTIAEANREIFQKIRSHWGELDVLINNAGIGVAENIAVLKEHKLQAMIDLNIRAATLCMQEALKQMKSKEEAVIINIGSMSGHRMIQGAGGAFYAGVKNAFRIIADGLRYELAEEKSAVKLCMISPGLVETEFHRVARDMGDDEKTEYKFPPLQPQDITDAVLYILSTPPTVQISDIMIRSTRQAS